MIALLVDEYKEQLAYINLEIGKLYATNSKNIERNLLKEIEKEIKKHLVIFNQDLISKKEMKFRKDKLAFENNRAYKWPSPAQPRWKPRRTRATYRESETSEESDHSSTKSFVSTNSTTTNPKSQHSGYSIQRNKKFGKGGWFVQTNKYQGDTSNSEDNMQAQTMGARPKIHPTDGMTTRMTIRCNKTMDNATNEELTTHNSTDFFENPPWLPHRLWSGRNRQEWTNI